MTGGKYLAAVLFVGLVLAVIFAACGALPEGEATGQDDSAGVEPTAADSGAGSRGGEPTAADSGADSSDRDIDRAVEATLAAKARDDAEYAQRQTIAARVATARAPTPTLTPPGLPSLAGEAHDCFKERTEDARTETIDELVQYIHHWEDARAMGRREVFKYRDRFIGVLVRWEEQGKPGIEFMLQGMCPDGDFTYTPPGG